MAKPAGILTIESDCAEGVVLETQVDTNIGRYPSDFSFAEDDLIGLDFPDKVQDVANQPATSVATFEQRADGMKPSIHLLELDVSPGEVWKVKYKGNEPFDALNLFTAYRIVLTIEYEEIETPETV